MRRVGVISVSAFLCVSILTLAQQQTTSTASIEGVVVRADNGEPVSGVQVELSRSATAPAAGQRAGPSAAPIPLTTTTGADGKFSFRNLAAGTYGLAATANGFARQRYGQLTSYGSSRSIFLTAGQAMKDAVIRLTATGTVRGKVLDETGQPAAGAPIQLIHALYGPLGTVLQLVGERSADDRGEFRVFGITPGRYYLTAGTPPGAHSAVPRYTFVYYPNSPEIEQATFLEVKAGDETAVDMRVRRQQNQTYRVRGRIIAPRGTRLPDSVRITILLASYSLTTQRAVYGKVLYPESGSFEFQGVTPGEYVVLVQNPDTTSQPAGQTDRAKLAAQTAARLEGRATVRVIDKDSDGVVITLTTAIMTSGYITVEGLSARGGLDNMLFGFSRPGPANAVGVLPSVSSPKPDGSFEVGLREGELRFQVNRVPPGFYVKSIDYGGSDILGRLHNFMASGVATFHVTICAGASQINGTVADVKSQPVPGIPVVLIPVDRNRMDLSLTVYADQNGRFAFPNLTPGDYKVFSWEAADTDAAYDPDFMKQHETQAPITHIAEASNQTVNVRMIPAPGR